MPPFRYVQDDSLVLTGDQIRMKRWIRRDLVGTVVFVHDPTKPSPPNGDNDFGFTAQVGDVYYWIGGPPNESFELIERSTEN